MARNKSGAKSLGHGYKWMHNVREGKEFEVLIQGPVHMGSQVSSHLRSVRAI